jgi:hypothetical protein
LCPILLGCVSVANDLEIKTLRRGCGWKGEEAGPADLHRGLSVLARVKLPSCLSLLRRKAFTRSSTSVLGVSATSAAAADSRHWQPSSGRESTHQERESLYSRRGPQLERRNDYAPLQRRWLGCPGAALHRCPWSGAALELWGVSDPEVTARGSQGLPVALTPGTVSKRPAIRSHGCPFIRRPVSASPYNSNTTAVETRELPRRSGGVARKESCTALQTHGFRTASQGAPPAISTCRREKSRTGEWSGKLDSTPANRGWGSRSKPKGGDGVQRD